ncbi:MAG: tetratricopeptide repeat protein, partial [Opitutaceae bacterium]
MLNHKQMALINIGIAHLNAGRSVEAARVFAQLRIQNPGVVDPWYLGGLSALKLGQHAQARTLFSGALKIAPKHHMAAYHLGACYFQMAMFAEAETSLRQAVAIKADYVEAWEALGTTLHVINRLSEALDAYRKITAIKPNRAETWVSIGTIQLLLGQSSDAIRSHQKAIDLNPELAIAYHARGVALHQSHRIREAIADFEKTLQWNPRHRESICYRLFCLNYLSDRTREDIFNEHVKGGMVFETPEQLAKNAERRFANPPNPERKLRLAFLSPDLRIHPVAFFLQPLIANLDKERFEIFLYHNHFDEDSFSAVLKRSAKVWRNFMGMSDDKVETLIRADSPDMLIDLAGHSGLNRLSLFARRLAPIQITYLGYPNTSGLRSMDYRLTDNLADPEGDSDAFFTEKLIRFSSCAWCFWPPVRSPDPGPLPCHTGAPLTFGSFNSTCKLSERILDIWSRVLQEVPDSRLLLKSQNWGERDLAQELGTRGIAPERITRIPATPGILEHLACYASVDIALDTFPYHGTTTTCEALWMGVP